MARTVFLNRETLVFFRRSRGWSQQDLANHADVEVRTVRYSEAGRPVFETTRHRLARALGVEPLLLTNALAGDPLNPRAFTAAVRKVLPAIERAEIDADFSRAVELLDTLLRDLPADDAGSPALRERREINERLGAIVRRAYRGGPDADIAFFAAEGRLAYASKEHVHQRRLEHPTVILLVVSQGKLCATYVRSVHQTCSGRRDFFGGHLRRADRSPRAAALREANEELQLYAGAARIPLSLASITQVGEVGEFPCYESENPERSTVFLVTLPSHPALTIRASDEDATGRRLVDIPVVRFDPFITLLRQYKAEPASFADGASRVFDHYAHTPGIQKALKRHGLVTCEA